MSRLGTIRTRGFTLIELMMTIALFGLLIMLAIPAGRVYIANTQVRTASEALLNGMQQARAEAVRRNTLVHLILGAGTTWTVGCNTAMGDLDGDGVDDCPDPIARRAMEEGGTAHTTIAVLPAGANTITFNGLGRVVANEDGSASITTFDVVSATIPFPETRRLRVNVALGGSVKMCDRDMAADDPRACP
ncbi:MAG TPA: GspH/FimT family pseudopilin [Burkholderiales bacterium]|nr:GspH/FimT family pseudopilin [Burkholderiales bacterium]